MKATRDQLKSLVRELLVEILQEGLGPSVGSPAVRPMATEARRRQPAQASGARQRPTFDPRLDTPLKGGRQPTDLLKEAVRQEAGGNPILADILTDTAMTTLPSQLSNDSPAARGGAVSRSSAPVQQEQFNGDPSEIFAGGEARGDGTSHWADLAFMSAKKPL